jgi:hypothetical protein
VIDALLHLPIRESEAVSESLLWPNLQDAVEEGLFEDQAVVSTQEQKRFQQMLRQLDHYLADQILVIRRRRAKLDERIQELEKKREKVLSAHAGSETVTQLASLNKQANELDRLIARLEDGGDEEYRTWRDRLFAKRFRKPEVVRILDVQFEIAAGDGVC